MMFDERMQRLVTENEAWKTWERLVAANIEQAEREDFNAELSRWTRAGKLKNEEQDNKGEQ